MFEIVLYQPEIPPNTGNIMRLCANMGARLHLVRPLGFQLNDRTLSRAGMDYRDRANTVIHSEWRKCMEALGPRRVFALSTRGQTRYDVPAYAAGDAFLFGPETRGLPVSLLDALPGGQVLRIPMHAGSRSLNLANAVAVVLYEAWRQVGFSDGS